ncbi:hypothetical protein TNCT_69071 [Trichonephila clavata]|uniref:Uncharacterized protein n=1 Tax=Trichonephila clavata TaxID=2740835 RepID=A0A8X6LDB6_TRICU|nr:hypothetical protein TNCT_69071 [Trichonephila clavata]
MHIAPEQKNFKIYFIQIIYPYKHTEPLTTPPTHLYIFDFPNPCTCTTDLEAHAAEDATHSRTKSPKPSEGKNPFPHAPVNNLNPIRSTPGANRVCQGTEPSPKRIASRIPALLREGLPLMDVGDKSVKAFKTRSICRSTRF